MLDTETDRIYDRITLHKLLVAHPEWDDTALAQAIGRQRSWVAKWKARVRDPQNTTFSQKYMSRSRAPQSCRKWVAPEVERAIVELRESLTETYHRPAGPLPIIHALQQRHDLKDEGFYLPTSPTTISAILRQHGYIRPQRQRERHPLVLPPPLEEWEIDFCLTRLADGSWMETFVAVDRGTSRVVYLEGCEGYNAESALETIARMLLVCGLPKRMRMDRDTRFVGAWTTDGYPSALLRFLRVLGVDVVICPPRKPWFKPYVERLIFTLKHEWFAQRDMSDLAAGREALETFPPYYHAERPHQGRACQGKTPDAAFPTLPSLPTVPEQVDPNAWLAHEHGHVFRRRIDARGMIQVDKHTYYVPNQRKRRVLVHVDAQSRQLYVQDGKDVLARFDIQGVLPYDTLDFNSFLVQMKAEARSAEWQRFLRWHREPDAA